MTGHGVPDTHTHGQKDHTGSSLCRGQSGPCTPLSLTRSQRSAAARRRAFLEMRPGDTCLFAPTVRRPRSAGACLAQGGGQESCLSAGPGPTGPQLGSPLWACLLPEQLGRGPCSGTGDGDPRQSLPHWPHSPSEAWRPPGHSPRLAGLLETQSSGLSLVAEGIILRQQEARAHTVRAALSPWLITRPS